MRMVSLDFDTAKNWTPNEFKDLKLYPDTSDIRKIFTIEKNTNDKITVFVAPPPIYGIDDYTEYEIGDNYEVRSFTPPDIAQTRDFMNGVQNYYGGGKYGTRDHHGIGITPYYIIDDTTIPWSRLEDSTERDAVMLGSRDNAENNEDDYSKFMHLIVADYTIHGPDSSLGLYNSTWQGAYVFAFESFANNVDDPQFYMGELALTTTHELGHCLKLVDYDDEADPHEGCVMSYFNIFTPDFCPEEILLIDVSNNCTKLTK